MVALTFCENVKWERFWPFLIERPPWLVIPCTKMGHLLLMCLFEYTIKLAVFEPTHIEWNGYMNYISNPKQHITSVLRIGDVTWFDTTYSPALKLRCITSRWYSLFIDHPVSNLTVHTVSVIISLTQRSYYDQLYSVRTSALITRYESYFCCNTIL